MPDLKNTSALISAMAARIPDQPAVIDGARTISFKALEEEISRLANGLGRAGITPGLRVALMVPPSIEFVALTFALFRAGAVIVLIDPGIGLAGMKACLAEARPEAFIGAPKAHAARLLFGWAKGSLRISITAGKKWLWPGFTLEDIRKMGAAQAPPPARAIHETAAILFTSGSTGVPKGAVYTHTMFTAQAAMLKEYFQIEPGRYSVPTFPLFALFDVALGMTIVIPAMDFTRPAAVDPLMLANLINKYEAVQLFGSPALLDTLSRGGETHAVRLPSLKRIISCGAPVSSKVINRTLKMLSPGTQVFTPYGATEALPVSCVSSGELAGLENAGPGICVGSTWAGMETFIIKISDAPIAAWTGDLQVKDGEIGEITVKGPVVSPEYFGRPLSNALAKIHGPDGAVYHRMGDTGWKDADGRLWFCGRKSHRVITGTGTLFTLPCEAVFNAHPGLRRTAVVGIGQQGAQTPVLCVELKKGGIRRESLTKELLALGAAQEHTRTIKTILYHPGFPVDIRHNAKISREKLAAWAEKKLT
ncbi:MAG: peptide synthase [Elusimicrobia bacterium RIFOXYA2_FULL_58_8]|nr:MAG: peptide synthase [Elusimicrobia bacterium RIFOXYA12_FULL_57_11]OGS13147.1 MAG: peptide synthase [Elusimicrobia bacterium RIFOXYA2_FULL_58_8]